MASLQEPGMVVVQVRKKREGNRAVELFRKHVSESAPGGGAPDGALSSVKTPDQRIFQPRVSSAVIEVDDIVEVLFEPEAADGIDVSDSVWLIPLTRSDGTVVTLSRAQFKNPTPADYTTVIDIPVVVGGWQSDARYQFGGGPIFVDVQDDTA